MYREEDSKSPHAQSFVATSVAEPDISAPKERAEKVKTDAATPTGPAAIHNGTSLADGAPSPAPSPLADLDVTDPLPAFPENVKTPPAEDADLFAVYDEQGASASIWDEAVFADGTPRPAYAQALEAFAQIGFSELVDRFDQMKALEREQGVTFRVIGETETREFPIDFIPRIVSPETWTFLSEGLEQRARALNAFLDDVYGEQNIVKAGIIDEFDLKRAPEFLDSGFLQEPGHVRAHICGMDLVCTDEGRWFVLEDNLRVPSGVTFANSIRNIERELFGEVIGNYDMHEPFVAFDMMRETMLASAPEDLANPDAPQLAVLSAGESDYAWFEHSQIAELIGAPVCTPERLAIRDGRLVFIPPVAQSEVDGAAEVIPIDVAYIRIEHHKLFSALGFDGEPLGPGLEEALKSRRLAFVNAYGNGVGDDKAIYAYVPEMIRFYLGEEPLLDQVPTTLCHKPGAVDEVIPRLNNVVVKPVDGYGGQGITIGPECSAEQLEQRAQELRENPENFIAQDVVRLSTLPTLGEDAAGDMTIHPRHVDLRVFVHVRPAKTAQRGTSVSAQDLTAITVPATLTRTAAAGTLIVNSSRGGGGKDTWILRTPAERGDNVLAAGALAETTKQ
ncbi:MAG: circularly permuted type 2 ATP-grasp protein [Corynebacterium sp.]|nr:circularly permuted type 2 ATP-grasp protein [Corynebacterium sp.]